jgi:YD repeat-containing protein
MPTWCTRNNAQGDLNSYEDRAGTVHEYTYDLLGRKLTDVASTIGSGVDDAVKKLRRHLRRRGQRGEVDEPAARPAAPARATWSTR